MTHYYYNPSIDDICYNGKIVTPETCKKCEHCKACYVDATIVLPRFKIACNYGDNI